ncbi:MAG: multiheme c-type cytochrome [Lysobacterales bacterium]
MKLAPICGLLGLLSSPLWAAVSGTVVEQNTLTPIAGAHVRVQADLSSPVAITNAAGEFTLAIEPTDQITLGAAVAYDPNGSINWVTHTAPANNGQTNVVIELPRLPATDNPAYQPPTAVLCGICHEEQHEQWLTSRHAGAATNPWVLDLHSGSGTPGGAAGYVFTDLHDPGETGFCATCHTPMIDVFTPGMVQLNEVVDPAALDGVSCLACHQIGDVDAGNINGLHHVGGKSQYRFPDNSDHPTDFYVFGSLADVQAGTMRNSFSDLFADSRMCAACHQYNNPDTGAPGQNTYVEWLASPYAQPGPDFRSCQDCHMPQADGPGLIAVTAQRERPAEQRHSHSFVGSTPATLSANVLLTVNAVSDDQDIVVDAAVQNLAGHSFPAGVSVRNAILAIEVLADGQPLVQTAGPVIPFYGSDEVPGIQPGDLADLPGKGFAKVLEGRINGAGPVVRPVLFIDAENVFANTIIPSGQTDQSQYRFAIPAGFSGNVQVSARLLYRRAWRALAVTKGWTITPGGQPIEIEVAAAQVSVPVGSGLLPNAIPTMGLPALLLIFGTLGLIGLVRSRRS